jgi:hypothetical protein
MDERLFENDEQLEIMYKNIISEKIYTLSCIFLK